MCGVLEDCWQPNIARLKVLRLNNTDAIHKFDRRSFLSPNRLLYGSGIGPLLYCSITKPRVV